MAGQISKSDQIKQFKEFLRTYNEFTETMTCSDHCLQKHLKTAHRISMRCICHIWQNISTVPAADLSGKTPH
uniref:Mitochondrial import inner membrane translocase subunit n=1 Tax=Calidris pygmaea TaxID=425635 RepID=A0A8C3KRF1_9CHAR